MRRQLLIKRWLTGLNVVVALFLAAALAVALNVLAAKHFWRADISKRHFYALSEHTQGLLRSLTTDIHTVVFVSSEHELYRAIRRLLREYEYASKHITVEYVDPHRNLARSKELALSYDLMGPDVVVFISGDQKKCVSIKDIAEYDYTPLLSGRTKIMAAFNGEQLFSAAIQSLLHARKPIVYFLSGHGERQLASYDQATGYSIVARTLQRSNIDLRTLNFGETPAIPQDCDLLAIAGPNQRFSRAEIELLKKFLDDSGRILLLLDSGTNVGLDDLLAAWGIRLCEDRVVGLTLTGRELLISNYGHHPITERMLAAKMVTLFNSPRSIQPLVSTNAPLLQAADKLRLTILASCSEQGWAEMSPNQTPPKFDADIDLPGPVSVALAVEKGPPLEMDVEIKPSRLVVLGDSSFVSNGALQAGYNAELFINAVNWLLERSDSLPIAAKKLERIQVVMDRNQFQLACGIIVMAIPATIIIIGLLVGLWRRR